MKNPVFLRSLGIVAVVVVFVGIGFFLLQKRNSASHTNQEQKQETELLKEKIPSTTTKTHTDEAGFQFNYPDDLTVDKKESTSSAVYADLELTSTIAPGKMTFRVEDTKEKTIDAWVKKNISSDLSATKEVVLGSLPAKEITTNDNFSTIAIDQGILFRLDILPQEENKYWQSAYNTVVSSFSFVTPQTTSGSSSLGGGEDVILEEEVIE